MIRRCRGDRADKRAGEREEDIRALGRCVDHFQLPPQHLDGATLRAGGHLRSQVIDSAAHRGRGLQKSANRESAGGGQVFSELLVPAEVSKVPPKEHAFQDQAPKK